MTALGHLRLIKVAHTIAWVFFAGCIVALLVFAWQGRVRPALWLIGIVMVEVGILAFNNWACPLTPLAARYTDDRRPNFDIYLPQWVARYNKEIFGSLFVVGIVLTLIRWLNR